jgi:hypothetical protein
MAGESGRALNEVGVVMILCCYFAAGFGGTELSCS